MSYHDTMTSAAAIAVMLACILSASAARTEDAVCKAVFDAGEKTMQTPNHQYVTQTGGSFGSKGRRSESIHTGVASYLLVDGQWHRSPLDIRPCWNRSGKTGAIPRMSTARMYAMRPWTAKRRSCSARTMKVNMRRLTR